MASERIRHAQTPDGDWVYVPSPTGTHITLPLDANALDAEAVEAAAVVIDEWAFTCPPQYMRQERMSLAIDDVRRVLAAYANHVAEVRNG